MPHAPLLALLQARSSSRSRAGAPSAQADGWGVAAAVAASERPAALKPPSSASILLIAELLYRDQVVLRIRSDNQHRPQAGSCRSIPFIIATAVRLLRSCAGCVLPTMCMSVCLGG